MSMKAKPIAYCALLCALIIVSTLWIKFPLPGTGILFTTQVFFVLLCGQLLPPRYCLYTIGAYLLLGLMGLPVFSATQGIAVVVTPTFGYLLAFPACAAITSMATQRYRLHPWGRYVAALLGIVVMYAIALPYIALLSSLYFHAPLPLHTLLSSYCLIFLPLDIVKGTLAAIVAPRLEKAMAFSK